ncbi:MAG: hypothetical protein JXA99_15780 [Candidatus Lokiarchaeota archaeon]|nr:hypothetical protein [Candidatus Lokiarchaeota archaeon]
MSIQIKISKDNIFRLYLFIWIIIITLTILIQFSLSELSSDSFIWAPSGWALYLTIYNITLIFVIIYALILNNKEILKFLVIIMVFFSFIIGTFNFGSMIYVGQLAIYNIIMVFIFYIMGVIGFYFYLLTRKESY